MNPGAFSGAGKAGSSIRSIQRGVITISAAYSGTATLGTKLVNVNKAVLTHLGATNSSDATATTFARITIDSETQVSAAVNRSTGAANVVGYQIVEYF